jgi:hypothetical protein
MAGDATRVDRALQGVEGLATIEDAQQLTTKDIVEKVVAQESGPQQPAEMDDVHDPSAAGYKSRELPRVAIVSRVHGSHEAKRAIRPLRGAGVRRIGPGPGPLPLPIV